MRRKKPKAVREAAARAKSRKEVLPPDQPFILRLPWDIRSTIIEEVIRHGRLKAPALSPKFVENRISVWNCFDESMPSETNLFVPKTKSNRIHGNGLLGTNRQLRQDTLDVLKPMMERDDCDIPYVLDLMIIEDYGVFPTWMSFPFQPKRMDQLQINVGMYRPGDSLLPEVWTYKKPTRSLHSWYGDRVEQRLWNAVTAIVLYSTGRLTLSPARQLVDNTRPVGKRDKNLPIVMDAHRAAAPLYAINHVFVYWHGFEYLPDGKPVPYNHDWPSRAAAISTRAAFEESSYEKGCRRSRDFGCTVATRLAQLLRVRDLHGVRTNIYHNALVVDIGSVVLWELSNDRDGNLRWFYYGGYERRNVEAPRTPWITKPPWVPADGDVAAALAEARKTKPRPKERIHGLRLVQRRIDLGWWGAEWKRARDEIVAERRGYNFVYDNCILDPGFNEVTTSDDESD